MKIFNKFKYPIYSVFMGLLVWAMDSIIDYLWFYKGHGTFIEILVTNPPPHEIYIRLIIMLVLIISGFIVSFHTNRQEKTASKLMIANQELQATLNSIADGVIATDTNGDIVKINRVASNLTGWKPEEAQGVSLYKVFNIINPQTRKLQKNPVSKVIKGVKIIGLADQAILISKDGKEYKIADNAAPIINKKGEITGAVLVFRDITKEYNTKKALTQRESFLQSLFRAAPTGIGVVKNRRFTQVNRIFCVMTGYNEEEIIGKSSRTIYPSDEEYEYVGKEKYNQIYKTGTGTVETKWKCKDGKIIDILLSSTPIDSNDNSMGVTFTALDITDRKEAEKKIKEQNEFMKIILDHMPTQIFWKDENLIYQGGNKAFANVVGIESPFKLIGMKDSDFKRSPYPNQENLKLDRLVLESGKPILDIEETFFHANGTKGIGLSSRIPIKFNEDEIIGVLGVCSDITQRRKAEEEIRKMQHLESLGTIAGGIAHDFNNMLTGLFGNMELANLSLEPKSDAALYLKEATKALESARQLAKQLLIFAKGGAPVIDIIETKSLITEVVRFNLHGSNTAPKFDLEENLYLLKADKSQISQVFANLTINAKQAMKNGGKLFITAKNIKNEIGLFVEICFWDEGQGISRENLHRIFDPYFTTKSDGHGLGLSIVHGIVMQHNGTIYVDSSLDKGTRFTILLPGTSQTKPLNLETPTQEENNMEDNSLKVLLMDDEEMVRDLSAKMLKVIGCSASTACDGDEAINKYKAAIANKTPFDLVIMDLTIPGGKGGQETAQELLKIDASAKIIVSSGYASNPVIANHNQYGFLGKLAKPFNMEELKKEIHRVSSIN